MKAVLQVEDDPNDVFFLQKTMKKWAWPTPFRSQVMDSRRLTTSRASANSPTANRFRCHAWVLLDLKLPCVMGLEVLKRIRQQFGMVLPVIILSASSENADIATAYRLGANAFLTKPSEASKLEEVVRAIKDFWLTHNKLPQESSPDLPRQKERDKDGTFFVALPAK